MDQPPVALITGASQRIGAAISRELHRRGYRVLIHCRQPSAAGQALYKDLNGERPDSARLLYADLERVDEVGALATAALDCWGAVDALINNASGFYPTAIGQVSEADWDCLVGSNLKGAFFLSQALAPALRAQSGAIVNIVDIYGEKPLAGHPVYSIAKAGLAMMTRSLALELAPEVRVNGIAPGAILPPAASDEFGEIEQRNVSERVPLARWGSADDIAGSVAFLLQRESYINGQIIAVDGGRSLSI